MAAWRSAQCCSLYYGTNADLWQEKTPEQTGNHTRLHTFDKVVYKVSVANFSTTKEFFTVTCQKNEQILQNNLNKISFKI